MTGMAMKEEKADRASYKVMLDRAVVAELRILAAEETLARTDGRCVTWVDLLRRAAAGAAK